MYPCSIPFSQLFSIIFHKSIPRDIFWLLCASAAFIFVLNVLLMSTVIFGRFLFFSLTNDHTLNVYVAHFIFFSLTILCISLDTALWSGCMSLMLCVSIIVGFSFFIIFSSFSSVFFSFISLSNCPSFIPRYVSPFPPIILSDIFPSFILSFRITSFFRYGLDISPYENTIVFIVAPFLANFASVPPALSIWSSLCATIAIIFSIFFF